MKRILFSLLVMLTASFVYGQDYTSIKNLVLLTKYKDAKDMLDKKMTDAKFTGKPEAYILKATIYSSLGLDNENKNKPSGDQLIRDADEAFKKFKEMDASMGLLSDLTYQNGVLNLYSGFYGSGYTDYTTKSFQSGFEKMKRAVEYSDLMLSRKIVNAPLDTNVLILAGILAESSKNNDAAAVYYTRLADHKIGGPDFESLYRFLVNYYFVKKDIEKFEKYKAQGKELYPKSEYFNYDKIDFAVGLVTDFDEKVKALQEVLAKDPDNYKANEILGEIIFDTLNPRKEGSPQPSNAAELEKTMTDAFKKAAAAKPGDENAYLFMGDHFIGKAVKINDARAAHAAEMKQRTKPGTMASKEDIAKRDLLDKQYGDALEQAREPYEKAAEIFAGKSSLELRDKQQYKKVANYLADIFAFKKSQATKNKLTADAAKYAAEEKKWNDRYDTIK